MGQAPQQADEQFVANSSERLCLWQTARSTTWSSAGNFRSVAISPRAASSCRLRRDGSAGDQSHQKYHQSLSIRAAASAL